MKLLIALLLTFYLPISFAQKPSSVQAEPVQAKKVVLARRSQIPMTVLKGEVNDESYVIFDEDIARNLNRLRVVKDPDSEDEEDALPDEILWKLFLARQVALLSINKAYTK